MSFVRVLIDSFVLLKKCPRFFIPKIFVAFLFFPIIIILPTYFVNFNLFSPDALSQRDTLQLIGLILQLIFLLAFTAVVYFIDSFLINPMYPVLVKQFYDKRRINFRQGFVSVIRRFGTIFASLLVFSILLFASMLPFMFIMVTGLLMKSTLLVYVSIAVAVISVLIMLVLFYLIYPVSSLESLDFSKVIKDTVEASVKHRGDVAKAVLFSLAISGLSYLLAFEIALTNSSEQMLFMLSLFALLILTRVLTAVFTTYQYVLNAVFYLGFEKGLFLGE